MQSTFGEQGIGQANVFQAEFIYVKILTFHEDGRAKKMDAVHYILIPKLRESSEWQHHRIHIHLMLYGTA